jgi:hypothetical protein
LKGLALAEEYFDTFGKPMLDMHFSGMKSRIAAGFVGMGSDCLGFDDQLSRDHDWGPGFCLWLEKDDYEKVGLDLQQNYDALPARYKGTERNISTWGRGRMGVHDIGGFYRSFIGLPRAPEKAMEWLVVPEYNLATSVNGKVFVDPSGEFSDIRAKILAYYPEDVRKKKLAARCMSAAQSGQYNYQRCLQREDVYGAWCALTTFCEDLLAFVFLFNRKFMPYFKWHCRAAAEMPILGKAMAQAVRTLCMGNDKKRKMSVIAECCDAVMEELRRQGICKVVGNSLLDLGPAIHSSIEDTDLRKLDVWYRGG